MILVYSELRLNCHELRTSPVRVPGDPIKKLCDSVSLCKILELCTISIYTLKSEHALQLIGHSDARSELFRHMTFGETWVGARESESQKYVRPLPNEGATLLILRQLTEASEEILGDSQSRRDHFVFATKTRSPPYNPDPTWVTAPKMMKPSSAVDALADGPHRPVLLHIGILTPVKIVRCLHDLCYRKITYVAFSNTDHCAEATFRAAHGWSLLSHQVPYTPRRPSSDPSSRGKTLYMAVPTLGTARTGILTGKF